MRLSRQVGPLESTPSIDDIFEPNRSLVNGLMLAEKLSRLKSINDHFVRIEDFRGKFFAIYFLMNYSCLITEKSQ